jgi:hypothetical protein
MARVIRYRGNDIGHKKGRGYSDKKKFKNLKIIKKYRALGSTATGSGIKGPQDEANDKVLRMRQNTAGSG